MKKYFAVLLFSIGTLIITAIPNQVSSLDYHIEGLSECIQSNSRSSECKKLYCERDNIEKNWPKDIGYYEDCSNYENQNTRYVIAGLLAVFGIIGTLFVTRKLVKNKSIK